MLQQFVELNNRVINRFSPAERVNIGIHTCAGGDCDSTHSAEVDYVALLPRMFKMNVGYFLIQAASERDEERVYKLCGQYSRKNANDVGQVCFVGVINSINPRVETADEVCADLVLASKYIPVERLGWTDDCGFSPFTIDAKPKHGSADAARETAFEKIAVCEGNPDGFREAWRSVKVLTKASACHSGCNMCAPASMLRWQQSVIAACG